MTSGSPYQIIAKIHMQVQFTVFDVQSIAGMVCFFLLLRIFPKLTRQTLNIIKEHSTGINKFSKLFFKNYSSQDYKMSQVP